MATSSMHKKLVKFGHVVFELCERTDRKTDIFITKFHSSPGVK